MKKINECLAGFLLSVCAVNSIHAQTEASEAATAAQAVSAASDSMTGEASLKPAAQNDLPPGVITEQNPLKLAVIANRTGAKKAYYRPNESMPDLSNEDILRAKLSSGKTIKQLNNEAIGSLPRLVVIPCSDGCSGSAYDDAVDALKKGYRGEHPNTIIQRGEMRVRISKFHHRSILANLVPTSNDSISIQFVLQGRLVTISKAGIALMANGNGGSTTAMAEELGATLAVQLLFELGLGIAPACTTPVPHDGVHKAMTGVITAGHTFLRAVGTDAPDSTVGPVPDGEVELLPAIDGIGPNEVEPLKETTAFGW
jgi:hypothetical protein